MHGWIGNLLRNSSISYWLAVLREAGWQALVLFDQNPKLLALGLLGAAVTAVLVLLFRGKEAFTEHLKANVVIVFGGAILTWALVVPYYLFVIPPSQLTQTQSQLSVSQERERAATIGRQGAEVQLQGLQGSESSQGKLIRECRQEIERLSKAPKVGTPSGTNPAGEAHQCWLDNHFEISNPHVKESHTATTAIIHCNYRIDAPWIVAVKFDKDFLYGNVGVPGSGVVMGGGSKQGGNIFAGEVSMPSVPANQLITVTIESASEQYPRALSGEVRSK
jgi:hypothetical protein